MKLAMSEAYTDEKIRLRDSLPLLFMHAGCLLPLWTGASRVALWVALVAYVARVFALTAGYHRYFSHNTFKTSRQFQFMLAWLGAAAGQRDPLWWAAHHRHHHHHADTEQDVHSPSRHGFLWAHIGWLLCPKYAATEWDRVRDYARFPELRFLNRHHYLAPLSLALALYLGGEGLRRARPDWGADGAQLIAWGFFVSSVAVYHVTFSINSLMHMLGRRRFATRDTSRNNAVLALLSMGEGWHNNHHRYPTATRQGFYWWELDLTYYLLRVLAALRVVWDLRAPPAAVLLEGRRAR